MIATICLSIISIALLGTLAYVTRRANDTVERCFDALERDRVEHRAEIQTLLQRIQAPEAAVFQHATQTAGALENVYPLTETEQAHAQDAHLAAQAVLAEIHGREAEMAADGFMLS